MGVSIHVPARGTTPRACLFRFRHKVSIHVPARGTTAESVRRDADEGFQSTFPHGERRACKAIRPGQAVVSIHVPARGTTAHRQPSHLFPPVSIHVPARGTTNGFFCFFPYIFGFNPRSRTGNDIVTIFPLYTSSVSIHVPARGTTQRPERKSVTLKTVSIHVPARGTTIQAGDISGYMRSFNPRSRTGNDRSPDAGSGRVAVVSIHVPARGTTFSRYPAGAVS